MRTVFFDVDTQLDFLYPAGALYVPGAERVVANLVHLNQHAGAHGIPLVSTTDAHTESDPEFQSWPHHCVAGCLGQRKPEGTVLKSSAIIPYYPLDSKFPHAAQYVLQKTVLDCFTNPNLPALLDVLEADRYVLYGVVTEIPRLVSCERASRWG